MNKKVLIGLLIGALFLFLTLRQIDFKSSWHYISQVNWYSLVIVMLVYTCAFLVRSLRWKYLLSPLKVLDASKLFFYLILGFFMNNLLPLRIGELVRAHITGQRMALSRSSVLATVVVERLFDGLSYVCLFLATILVLPLFPDWAKRSMIVGSLLFIGCFIFLFFLVRHQDLAIKLFFKLPFPQKICQRVQSMFVNFVGGLQIFSRAAGLLKVFGLSLIVWSIEGAVFLTMSKAFHMNLNIFQCFLVMIVIGTGAILPTAPGYVGTVEFLGVTSLAFLGVDKNQAFGLIITLHTLQLLTISAWGIYAMFREKIAFSQLIHIEKQS